MNYFTWRIARELGKLTQTTIDPEERKERTAFALRLLTYRVQKLQALADAKPPTASTAEIAELADHTETINRLKKGVASG